MATATPAVEARRVGVTLNGVPIVREVDLEVGGGEVVAILGNNGSGKTTLMRAIVGLVPHTGELLVFGTPLERFAERERIGYVPQRSTIGVQQATVREVVAGGRLARRRLFWPESAADRRAITTALEEVGLGDRAAFPFVQLSGGQQQRALIARALATGADLMLWDEPLAGVDRTTQELLASVAAGLRASGTTIVMVLHELGPFAPLIDRVITLADGRVLPAGASHHDHEGGQDHDREHALYHRHYHGGHEVSDLRQSSPHRTGLEG